MSTESDTPRTDALMPDQVYKRTMYEHILVMESHARQLERELNEVTKQRDRLLLRLKKVREYFANQQSDAIKTYRKITILFADEEPAQAYADEAIAQTVLERCEEWREKMAASETELSVGAITPMQHVGVMGHLIEHHPLSPSYANAQDYALKTVFLHE